jgi:hypothetical protein
MNDFNPEQYRASLKEKLGIKNLPIRNKPGFKTDFVNSGVSSVSTDGGEFGADGGGEAASPVAAAVAPAPVAAPGQPGVEGQEDSGAEGASEEQLAPAMALLHNVLQSINEQTASANDHAEGVMWRSLHNYIWKSRAKIAKKMMDDAQ